MTNPPPASPDASPAAALPGLHLASTLDLVSRLDRAVRDTRAAAADWHRNLEARRTDLRRQLDQTLATLHSRVEQSEHELRARTQARVAALDARQQARARRIAAARPSAELQRSKSIAAAESREVFNAQRDLLQTGRDRDAARLQANEDLTAFQTLLVTEQAALDADNRATRHAFRGYAAFVRLLETPDPNPAPPAPGATHQDLLQESQSLRAKAAHHRARFRRAPLPRLFSLLSPGWIAGLLLVGHGAAPWLLPQLSRATLTWPQAGLSLALALGALAGLHGLGRRLSTPLARDLARALADAQQRLAASDAAARAHHRTTLERIDQDAESRTTQLRQRWSDALEQADQQRQQLKQRLDAKEARALAHIDTRARNGIRHLESQLAAQLDQLQLEQDAGGSRATTEHSAATRQLEADAESQWQPLNARWLAALTPVYEAYTAATHATARCFPPWTDPAWDAWSPPRVLLPAGPIGHLELDVARYCDGLPDDPRLALPGPARLHWPLWHLFPLPGLLLIETSDAGRDAALGTLNQLVLRLLSVAPPGRALFTLLDPVGLGESFAGLMHLADHEDRLINRRIWTQPDQIEQRLADLNEHVEKVTQLYLRNAYPTIAEYNAQAGRIAEPFHVLVVADLPVHFSDLALRRLLSLAASGPRCGVGLLLHWDRRRPASTEAIPEDLRQAGTWIRETPAGFELAHPALPGVPVRLEDRPPAARVTSLLQQIGRHSVDSNRVEMPFPEIAPSADALWSLDTTQELRVPIGITGGTKRQHLALGKGTRQHVLVAGKTGAGKSTLFHVLITNLALWCHPDQVEFYLVDFKKGVEFKCYATHRLPHARVVAIESDRDFGLSVLQRVDAELQRRGDLFRQAGVQDLPGYKRTPNPQPLPRTLLIIDEFQEFFTEDDRVAQNAALLLDRLVRQGRAFGIHVLLGSQTLGGAYTLARTTLGQMVVRIALQSNEADALLIMEDNNTAPRLLSRPGEAIYNDAAGALEGNSPFQIVWLSESERDTWLSQLHRRAAALTAPPPPPVVFEGNAPADLRDNLLFQQALRGPRPPHGQPPHVWLGAPNSIKGPTEVLLQRQSGNHLLVVGQYDESTLALLAAGLLALAIQQAPHQARFRILDTTPPGSTHRLYLERLTRALPHDVALVGPNHIPALMRELAADLDQRTASGAPPNASNLYLVIHHLQRFKSLRAEDDFGLSLGTAPAAPEPGTVLSRLLTEGGPVGIHVLCTCDTYNNLTRFLPRKTQSEFELRALFQMSAADSASLIDHPKASTLGLHRAVLYNAQQGSLETFRPYGLPDPAWLDEIAPRLTAS